MSPRNPRPAVRQRGRQVALDLLELWVSDLHRMRGLLTGAFGFEEAAMALPRRPDEEAVSLVRGGVTIVMRCGTSRQSLVARHVALHGDTVADVALVSPDASEVAQRAMAYGLTVTGSEGCWCVDLLGDGTICHTVRETGVATSGGPADRDSLMRRVDHVAYCVPFGMSERLAGIYETVFGLGPVDVGECEDVGGDEAGMRSLVLRSGPGFTVVLTEPASPEGNGQTQRFIDAHAGPGVQHAAFACDDLISAVESLRATGVEFLAVPEEYFRQSERRLGDLSLPWDVLRRSEILVDADEDGLLFQMFTRPITPRSTLFVELIQRSGATGFGANNVRALFAAVDGAASGRQV